MSMSPDKLTEEFNEIQKAALDTWLHADPNGVVDSLKIEIEAWWHGAAAVAFSEQMSRISNCLKAQSEYTQFATHAVSMMYALSAQFRASCRDLMEKTADTCDAIAAEQPNPGLNWSSIGTSFAKAVVDGIKGADPGKLKDWAVDQLLGGAAAVLEPKPVAGDQAIPVASGYISARDSLFASYEDNLEQIRAWIQARWAHVEADTVTIPVTLPPSTDVDSPDFRYENFAGVDDSANRTGSSVTDSLGASDAMSPRALVGLVIVVAVTLSGCGGSDTPPPPPPSRTSTTTTSASTPPPSVPPPVHDPVDLTPYARHPCTALTVQQVTDLGIPTEEIEELSTYEPSGTPVEVRHLQLSPSTRPAIPWRRPIRTTPARTSQPNCGSSRNTPSEDSPPWRGSGERATTNARSSSVPGTAKASRLSRTSGRYAISPVSARG